jgi:transcriptional regulator with XRE-family HTH domain
MALISPLKLNISNRLRKDREFRKRFFQGQAQDEIAMNIRSLREKRTMRQVDLARESKMKQSAISRIEQADYSSWSFNTLLRVADALDARLRVTLEPAEIVIERYEGSEVAVEKGSQQYAKVHLTNAMESEIDTMYLSVQTVFMGQPITTPSNYS